MSFLCNCGRYGMFKRLGNLSQNVQLHIKESMTRELMIEIDKKYSEQDAFKQRIGAHTNWKLS